MYVWLGNNGGLDNDQQRGIIGCVQCIAWCQKMTKNPCAVVSSFCTSSRSSCPTCRPPNAESPPYLGSGARAQTRGAGARSANPTATRSPSPKNATAPRSSCTSRAGDAPPTGGRCRRRGCSPGQPRSLLLLQSAAHVFAPALSLVTLPLSGQLALEVLGLDLLEVLGGAVPFLVENQTLIVFGLGKDARPGI